MSVNSNHKFLTKMEKKHTMERYENTSFKTAETQLHVNRLIFSKTRKMVSLSARKRSELVIIT